MTDAAQPAATDVVESWVDRYHRALLTHLKIDLDDVDMSSVIASSGWSESWSYSEYTGGGAEFSLTATWRSKTTSHPYMTPDWDGLYTHSRELTNEEVAEFLNSLTQH